jgi:hypothetical protein
MTQLSRPYQIALAALALFAAVWFVALHGHKPSSGGGSGTSASGSSAPASPAAPSPAAQAKSAAAPTPVYHGAAPGVEGLTRAIAKAHGAVAQSQSEAKRLENAQPSGATSAAKTSTAKTSTAASSASQAGSHAAGGSAATTAHAHSSPSAAKPSAPKSAAAKPSMQAAVEHELRQGKTALILFWSPKGSDDVAVHNELAAVQRALGGKIAVHYASASQVGAFGTITHAVQVTQTPTLLIVNSHGRATVLTGLTDVFSIEQSVSEAKA